MAEALRFHVRTNDAVLVEVTSPDGEDITDGIPVVAGLGTAWRPPADGALTSCDWVTPVGPVRSFAMRVNATQAPVLAPGVYRVWFRPTVPPLAPLVLADVSLVLFGEE